MKPLGLSMWAVYPIKEIDQNGCHLKNGKIFNVHIFRTQVHMCTKFLNFMC